jgi:tmRNA-binding protein
MRYIIFVLVLLFPHFTSAKSCDYKGKIAILNKQLNSPYAPDVAVVLFKSFVKEDLNIKGITFNLFDNKKFTLKKNVVIKGNSYFFFLFSDNKKSINLLVDIYKLKNNYIACTRDAFENKFIINEVCIKSPSFKNLTWIEIKSVSSKKQNLKGCRIESSKGEIFKFNDNFILPPYGVGLIIFCNDKKTIKQFLSYHKIVKNYLVSNQLSPFSKEIPYNGKIIKNLIKTTLSSKKINNNREHILYLKETYPIEFKRLSKLCKVYLKKYNIDNRYYAPMMKSFFWLSPLHDDELALINEHNDLLAYFMWGEALNKKYLKLAIQKGLWVQKTSYRVQQYSEKRSLYLYFFGNTFQFTSFPRLTATPGFDCPIKKPTCSSYFHFRETKGSNQLTFRMPGIVDDRDMRRMRLMYFEFELSESINFEKSIIYSTKIYNKNRNIKFKGKNYYIQDGIRGIYVTLNFKKNVLNKALNKKLYYRIRRIHPGIYTTGWFKKSYRSACFNGR